MGAGGNTGSLSFKEVGLTQVSVRIKHEGLTTKAIVMAAGKVGNGEASCARGDVYSERIGEGIALGRALQCLGLEIETATQRTCVTKREMARVNRFQAAEKAATEELPRVIYDVRLQERKA